MGAGPPVVSLCHFHVTSFSPPSESSRDAVSSTATLGATVDSLTSPSSSTSVTVTVMGRVALSLPSETSTVTRYRLLEASGFS